MESFLEKFFPGLLKRAAHANRDVYCTYNNQALTAFTSSLYAFGMAFVPILFGIVLLRPRRH